MALGYLLIQKAISETSPRLRPRRLSELIHAVAKIEDAIQFDQPRRVHAAELRDLLMSPYQPAATDRRQEQDIQDQEESFEKYVQSTWGFDAAQTWWFVAIGIVSWISAFLFLGIPGYALDSAPKNLVLGCLIVAGTAIAIGASLIGFALYRQYLTFPRQVRHFSYGDTYDPELEVQRIPVRKIRGYWVYASGSVATGSSIVLALAGHGATYGVDGTNVEHIRLAALASFAVALPLIMVGSWPIVRRIIANSFVTGQTTSSRRIGRIAVPISVLPAIVSALVLMINALNS